MKALFENTSCLMVLISKSTNTDGFKGTNSVYK